MHLKAIALHVPDLEEAEAYYQGLFNMRLVGREAPLEGTTLDTGDWATLPFDKTWEDARDAGIEIGMLSLVSGGFHLALFPGQPQTGTVFAIALTAGNDDLAAIRQRITDEAVLENRDGYLEFFDRYGFHWQIGTDSNWATPGQFADRWLDV